MTSRRDSQPQTDRDVSDPQCPSMPRECTECIQVDQSQLEHRVILFVDTHPPPIFENHGIPWSGVTARRDIATFLETVQLVEGSRAMHVPDRPAPAISAHVSKHSDGAWGPWSVPVPYLERKACGSGQHRPHVTACFHLFLVFCANAAILAAARPVSGRHAR